MKKLASLLCCLLVAGLYGCGAKGQAVADIGKSKITLKTLEERIMDAPAAYQSYLTTNAGRKQFLDLLVRERIVVETAKKAGVNKQDEYKKAIGDFKKDQARKFKEYQESLLMELYVRELHDRELNASDKEIEAYYNEHKEEFAKPLEVTALHVLVPTRQEAESVLARINAGENFAKVAKEVSTDPISASRGGEIGPFRRGDLVPEFEKAVFPLKVGQVSGIVETQFGFHVIKKIRQKALPARSLEEAKYEIKKLLEKNKFDTWLENAKTKLNVKVNYELLSKLPAAPQMMQPPADQQPNAERGSGKK